VFFVAIQILIFFFGLVDRVSFKPQIKLQVQFNPLFRSSISIKTFNFGLLSAPETPSQGESSDGHKSTITNVPMSNIQTPDPSKVEEKTAPEPSATQGLIFPLSREHFFNFFEKCSLNNCYCC
jgi:hypothetical protein